MDKIQAYADLYFSITYLLLIAAFIIDAVITILIIGKPIKFTRAIYRSTDKKYLFKETAIKFCLFIFLFLGVKDRILGSSGALEIAILYLIGLGWAVVDILNHIRGKKLKEREELHH